MYMYITISYYFYVYVDKLYTIFWNTHFSLAIGMWDNYYKTVAVSA